MSIWRWEDLPRGKGMILLKKINSAPIAVNSDLIQYIEETPDSVITLTSGDKVIVQESMGEIISKIVEFRCLISGSVQSAAQRHLRRVHSGGRRPA